MSSMMAALVKALSHHSLKGLVSQTACKGLGGMLRFCCPPGWLSAWGRVLWEQLYSLFLSPKTQSSMWGGVVGTVLSLYYCSAYQSCYADTQAEAAHEFAKQMVGETVACPE